MRQGVYADSQGKVEGGIRGSAYAGISGDFQLSGLLMWPESTCSDGKEKAKRRGGRAAVAPRQKLTGLQFVDDSRWGGFVPAGDALSEQQTGPPVPFADLHWQHKANVLRDFISW